MEDGVLVLEQICEQNVLPRYTSVSLIALMSS